VRIFSYTYSGELKKGESGVGVKAGRKSREEEPAKMICIGSIDRFLNPTKKTAIQDRSQKTSSPGYRQSHNSLWP